jgi:hypothetical protein
MTRILIAAIAAAIVAVTSSGDALAAGKDSYYYPPVTSEELFSRKIIENQQPNQQPGRAVRVGLMTQITKSQLAAPDSPRFVVFAKGNMAQNMIIIALDDDVFKTLYRARAVMAQLTSSVRGAEFFANNIQDYATWFDLANMLGFEDLVISDGETWSHRVVFE